MGDPYNNEVDTIQPIGCYAKTSYTGGRYIEKESVGDLSSDMILYSFYTNNNQQLKLGRSCHLVIFLDPV